MSDSYPIDVRYLFDRCTNGARYVFNRYSLGVRCVLDDREMLVGCSRDVRWVFVWGGSAGDCHRQSSVAHESGDTFIGGDASDDWCARLACRIMIDEDDDDDDYERFRLS